MLSISLLVLPPYVTPTSSLHYSYYVTGALLLTSTISTIAFLVSHYITTPLSDVLLQLLLHVLVFSLVTPMFSPCITPMFSPCITPTMLLVRYSYTLFLCYVTRCCVLVCCVTRCSVPGATLLLTCLVNNRSYSINSYCLMSYTIYYLPMFQLAHILTSRIPCIPLYHYSFSLFLYPYYNALYIYYITA